MLSFSKSNSDSDDRSMFIKAADEEEPFSLLQVFSNDEYIGKIRRHLQENAIAREEREKRRRKVLSDQLKAHQAQEVGFVIVVVKFYSC